MRSVRIEGGGIAGQVLHRELILRGIPCELHEWARFPRDKVCGGVLQADSWRYLNSVFEIPNRFREISSISHHWRGNKLSQVKLKEPMVFMSRCDLDEALNLQPRMAVRETTDCLRVLAHGTRHSSGEWLGFQGQTEPVEEIQIHYGRGIYLGISPASEARSHVALIVKKRLFRNQETLKTHVRNELGVSLGLPLKGTAGIHYHAFASRELAVGDAKLVTHPFLGLGMKHAILSARLLARLISEGLENRYDKLHEKIFGRYRRASWLGGKLYDSPFSFLLKPFLRSPVLFSKAHAFLHGSVDVRINS